MAAWRKLGLIAGGGDLPVLLAEHLRASGQSYFVARVAPFADGALEAFPGATHDVGAMGARIDAMKAAGCDAVMFVGRVPRQDLRSVAWDEGGRLMLPALAAGAIQGDDALLRALMIEHEKAGFRIIGAEEAMAGLLAPAGALGAHAPSRSDIADMARAAQIVDALGAFDIGQGAVVCAGLCLAVEAQEGTDKMLERVATLDPVVLGSASARRGVLLKRPKPTQDLRIDLPVIGVSTIERAAAAGLAGVAVETGRALIVRRADVIAAADAAGLFVYGFTAGEFEGA